MLQVLKGEFIMVNIDTISKDDVKELTFTEARERPIVFDEDCPETTPERAVKFRRVNPPRDTHGLRA